MNNLTGDDIFYGSDVPRLAIEDILDEAKANPKGYAQSLIDHCRDLLVEHFVLSSDYNEISFAAGDNGEIEYSLVTDNGERRGHIPVEDIHTDGWYHYLLRARSA